MTKRTIPILPCRSIDDVLAFYRAIGFNVTYQQERPNTYAVVQRGGIELQFFVLKGLDPAESYSSCYVLVTDVDGLYEAFAAGLRDTLGRVPTTGDGDLNFLRVPVLDDRGTPIHDRGAARIPGVHFIGLRWMTDRSSGLIRGADTDAAELADRIAPSHL